MSGYADYTHVFPKADLVLVTHSHYDHFDRAAIDAVTERASLLVCDKTTAEGFEGECLVMRPGDTAAPRDYVRIEAVAASLTPPRGTSTSHPRERARDVGFTCSRSAAHAHLHCRRRREHPEMESLRDIDIAAFLPVNQPYTMTVDRAAEAVRALRPKIFYPYHYGEVEGENRPRPPRVRMLEGVTEIRIRPME